MFSQRVTERAGQQLSDDWKKFLDERKKELDGKYYIGVEGNDQLTRFQVEDWSGAKYWIDKATFPGGSRPIVYVGQIKFDGYNPVLIPVGPDDFKYENCTPRLKQAI